MSKKTNKRVEHYFSGMPESEDRFGLVRTRLRGRDFEFLTSSSVFSKRQVDLGTRVLVEAMVLPSAGWVFDVGCGYGVAGIVAAALNPSLHVVMSDVNMRAVRLARRNVELNRVSRNVEVHFGSFYEPVGDLKFNCVLSNPPISAGMETVRTIISGAKGVLELGGSFQMVIRSKIGAKVLPEFFEKTFGNCSVVARESGYRVLMGMLVS
jgi:16S rRNA (guanine1207-N2)-methyltransferase